jgi:hypothetical protein
VSLRNELALYHHPKPKLLPEPDAAYATCSFLAVAGIEYLRRANYEQPNEGGFLDLAKGAQRPQAAPSGQLISGLHSAVSAAI